MTEPERCLVCWNTAEVECAGCDAPLCENCATMRDYDPFCPGGKCLL